MRILAFTDTHEDPAAFAAIKEKAKYVDLIICAGDFTLFERDTKKILKQFASLKKPLLLIHGNHEYEENVEAMCDTYENIIFLHERYFEQGGKTFVGYGGGGFAKIDPRLDDIRDDLAEHLHNNILIVHQPPHGACDWLDWLGDHAGSSSITKLIQQGKPKLCICGHLHENFHKRAKIGKTLVINPGPDGEILDLNSKL